MGDAADFSGELEDFYPSGTRPRGLDWFLAKPTAWQKDLIRQPWLFPVCAMHLAAMAIQRTWRPCWLRTFAEALRPSVEPGRRQSVGSDTARRRSARTGPFAFDYEKAQAAIAKRRARVRDAMRSRYLALLRRQCELDAGEGGRQPGFRAQPMYRYQTFEHYCAALIQAAWRARRGRFDSLGAVPNYRRRMLYNVAAFEIQRAWRAWRQRQEEERLRYEMEWQNTEGVLITRTNHAVMRLQRMWRRVSDYRTYRSLKEVISGFQGAGDPCLLLRSILPREALLLDPSLQIHLRFRLGGSRFPPTIYYKVFTHGPICDLGAFAPRNYAGEKQSGRTQDTSDWYQRVENNGWRPLAVRDRRGPDEVERASARKVIKNFHYSRLRRRQDLERQRRRKTVEWMRRLYTHKAPSEGRVASEAGSWGGGTAQDSLSAPGALPRAPAADERLGWGSTRAKPSLYTSSSMASFVSRGSAPSLAASDEPLWRGAPPPAGGEGPAAAAPGGVRKLLGTTLLADASPSSFAPRTLQDAAAAGFGGEANEDEDDLGLLNWSSQLDFDAYMETWQRIAMSDVSEGTLPVGKNCGLSANPPLVH